MAKFVYQISTNGAIYSKPMSGDAYDLRDALLIFRVSATDASNAAMSIKLGLIMHSTFTYSDPSFSVIARKPKP